MAAAVAVAFADSSIVVLALPELYVGFETTIPRISWVISAYNVAVVVGVGVVALLPFARRARPARTAVVGLTIFLAASIACAVAGNLAWLVAGRTAQGVGAALLLGASLPLMAVLSGVQERAVAVWIGAGLLGTAVGPALGGLLTEAFNWRAIFAAQAPVAAAALAAALHARTRGLPRLRGRRARIPLAAALGLVLLFAALVGALFLAVLLIITVWDYTPLAGASLVSVLPLAALVPRSRSSRPAILSTPSSRLRSAAPASASLCRLSPERRSQRRGTSP